MLSTLFVTDNELLLAEPSVNCISFLEYLNEYPKAKGPKVRIINLCDSGRYLSNGYYCSLLAEARAHPVLPSVRVINSLRESGTSLLLNSIPVAKKVWPAAQPHALLLCMGVCQQAIHQKLANWLYQQFPAPLLLIEFQHINGEQRLTVSRVSIDQLDDSQRQFCIEQLKLFASKAWRTKADKKRYRWELAILTNPDEKVPPSNKSAISRFIRAAEKHGIRAVEIGPDDLTTLPQYDALFIRETTAIDHHTYRFANEAEKAGLVVIDDPSSILRCCNKVYLHDAFTYRNVPSLRTFILADNSASSLDKVEHSLGYPMVLKIPESAFSKGVFKVSDRAELEAAATSLLADSALFIAQEYLYTEFDWRIGVLNGRAIYACRYYMAKNHWQIYNHSSKRNFSGGFDALPTFEVPSGVLQAALKAAATVGNGLYGIDIKEVDGRAYVLEVNDNPSLEHGVEDAYLGEELYMQVMAEFLRRLEIRGLS
ncbi:RimK family protein [Neiella sp. HB171785]|uniref:RimK family protein n=1 Tax=Neiella litorisoli TaxID=2771431 RepID=A0A8J6QQW6_9GAMM|nr:RimK family protein [Neiella litorisoli]